MRLRLGMAAFCARQAREDKWFAADPDLPCAACTNSSDEPALAAYNTLRNIKLSINNKPTGISL